MSWFAWMLIIGYILLSLSLYKVFEKVGEEGWKALVPGLNFVVCSKLVGRKPWYPIWLLVPIVNVFIYSDLMIDMVRSFGKYRFIDSFLAVVAAPFYFFYLGTKPEEKYLGPTVPAEKAYAEKLLEAEKKGSKRTVAKLQRENPYRKSQTREWTEAIVFAVFAAALIRLFLIEAYVIPTSSMEGSLMVGDFLFVSKAHYGIRTPKTVAMIPLLHNVVPKLGVESYLEKPSLEPKRLPSIENIERNSPVVFNLPAGDSVYVFPERTWTVDDQRYGMVANSDRYTGLSRAKQIRSGSAKLVTRPLDKRDHYIKRAIGMPGDSLQIIDRQVYINGQPADNPTYMQFRYIVNFPDGRVNERNFAKWGISDEDIGRDARNPAIRYLFLNEEQKANIQAMDAAITFEPFPDERTLPNYNANSLFPHDGKNYGPWSRDNYGPIWIPKKGVTVQLNRNNINMFRRIIDVYEDNELTLENGGIQINGEPATEYTFKMDYYWMMGDNRHNSEDSRVWGFVPEDHVVGKPLFIWFSLREGSLSKGINWSRIFTSADKR